MKNIFTSVDIGSDTVKVVTCELFNNRLNLLAASSVKSKGIKMGLIIDPKEASKSVKEALTNIESQLGIEIKKVVATIPSNFAEFSFIKGDVEVNHDTGVVEGEDVVEVLQNAMETKRTVDKEMVTTIPIDFRIDGSMNVTVPLGMKAKTLSTRAIMVTTPKKNVYSVVSVLEDCGVDVVDIMISGIGDISSLSTKETEDKIGAIVNIGAETINVSLYNKNVIVKNSVLGVGGRDIDDVLAQTYRLELKEAKRLKEKFALAHRKYASVSDFYEVTNVLNEDIKINQYEVTEICMKNLKDLLELIKKEIKFLSDKDLDYIIFTGGVSMMSHFDYLASEYFDRNIEIGKIKVIGVRHNMYSASLGNIIYFIGKLKLKGKNYSMINTRDMETLSSKRTTNVAGDTMLGKVVDYFFGE